jgi:hypothetical protein
MSWRLGADIRPAELHMSRGQAIHPLAFMIDGEMVAAACLRKIRDDEYCAGVLMRAGEGFDRPPRARACG